MRCKGKIVGAAIKLLSGGMLFMSITSAFSQVSPYEITDSRAKADEEKYLPHLQSLQKAISAARFPFPLRLARYLHAKPGQRAALDSNGIEFVHFQDRVVLKISAIYSAAFNPGMLSRNQRASRTFEDVVVPVLRLVAKGIPQSADYDGIGFEILYKTTDADKSYAYRGKEVLSVVLARDDAFSYANTVVHAERQKVLNRSGIYVNGEEFGLALGQHDPLNVEALQRSIPPRTDGESSSIGSGGGRVDVVSGGVVSPAVSVTQSIPASTDPPTFADAMRMQSQFGPQLDALRVDGRRFHLVESAAPSVEISGDQTILHLTLRNTLSFDRGTTSIYKRAAQSFDLFLAPELRDLSRTLPASEGYDAIELSVLNQFAVTQTSPEAIDYICPLRPFRAFVGNKITSQDLINQSIVLVNGVRISLNLELVE